MDGKETENTRLFSSHFSNKFVILNRLKLPKHDECPGWIANPEALFYKPLFAEISLGFVRGKAGMVAFFV